MNDPKKVGYSSTPPFFGSSISTATKLDLVVLEGLSDILIVSRNLFEEGRMQRSIGLEERRMLASMNLPEVRIRKMYNLGYRLGKK